MDETRRETIRAGQVAGAEVYAEDGTHIGHVVDLVIDAGDGRVRVAVVSVGGFLGLGEEYHPLPWTALRYDPRRGAFVTSASREELEKAPRFAAADEPDWGDDVYQRNLASYYGQPYLI